jgi:hypothetical protein
MARWPHCRAAIVYQLMYTNNTVINAAPPDVELE